MAASGNKFCKINLAWVEWLLCIDIGSPTKKEADEAYERGEWFDVEVNSWRILRRISRRRRVVLGVLRASSDLLH